MTKRQAVVEKRILPNEELLTCVAELVASGRKVVLQAKGNSMLPSIRWGLDSVELVAPSRVESGMIALVCLKNGSYVLHRIESVDGNRLTLRGDGNLDGREYCTAGDVLAVVSRIIKPSGRAIDCESCCYKRRIKCWLASPRLYRRVVLGLYRRFYNTNK